ncbi:hypothetical protein DSUL_160079 [Desulfovibrionales bacterium]
MKTISSKQPNQPFNIIPGVDLGLSVTNEAAVNECTHCVYIP